MTAFTNWDDNASQDTVYASEGDLCGATLCVKAAKLLLLVRATNELLPLCEDHWLFYCAGHAISYAPTTAARQSSQSKGRRMLLSEYLQKLTALHNKHSDVECEDEYGNPMSEPEFVDGFAVLANKA